MEGINLYSLILGYGTFVWADKRKYNGNWKNSMMNGQGELFYPDGRYYKGRIKLNIILG